jgi:hypothetical protein
LQFQKRAARSNDQYRRCVNSSQPQVIAALGCHGPGIAVLQACLARLAGSRQEQRMMAQGLAEVGGRDATGIKRKSPARPGF